MVDEITHLTLNTGTAISVQLKPNLSDATFQKLLIESAEANTSDHDYFVTLPMVEDTVAMILWDGDNLAFDIRVGGEDLSDAVSICMICANEKNADFVWGYATKTYRAIYKEEPDAERPTAVPWMVSLFLPNRPPVSVLRITAAFAKGLVNAFVNGFSGVRPNNRTMN